MDWNGRGRSAAGGSHPTPTRTVRREGGRRRPRTGGRSGQYHRVSTGWGRLRRRGPEAATGNCRGTVTTLRAMLIGAHVREDDPVASAAERGAEIVQMFLADPQGWKKPPGAPAGRRSCARGRLTVVVHAPYVVNLASLEQPDPHPVPQAGHAARRGGGRGRGHRARRARRARHRGGRPRGRRGELAQVPRSPGGRGRLPGAGAASRTPRAATTPWPGGSTRWPACGTRSASSASASASTPATRTRRARSWSTWSTGSRRSPAGSTSCTSTTPATSSARRRPAREHRRGHDRPGRPGRRVRRGRRARRGRDPGGGPGRGHRVPARAARVR